jgi:glycosyltransferase involved in cell wall biosynthesis
MAFEILIPRNLTDTAATHGMDEPEEDEPRMDEPEEDEPRMDEPEEAGLVSVIVIFLNEERYLRDAVESVLRQDYSSWELLLVDDGSNDASPAIAREYAASDGRIQFLTHPGGGNRGMSAARNLGLAHARGEYVAFLDADDVYLPQRLSRHVEVLQKYPHIAVTGSSYIRWLATEAGAPIRREDLAHLRHFVVAGDVVWNPPLGLVVVTRVPYLNMGTFSLTVRRRVAREVGGFEDRFRSLYEDQVFASKLLARFPFYVIQDYLALYRHHEESATRRAKAAAGRGDASAGDSRRFMDWLLGYLEEHGIDDPLLLELVRERERNEAAQPGMVQRARARAGASVKHMIRLGLPQAWQRRLLALDYELDARRARAQYEELTRTIGRRAAEGVLSDAGE